MTPALPLVAPCNFKMRALSRESPAVVQRPHDGNIVFLDVAEQNRKIYCSVV